MLSRVDFPQPLAPTMQTNSASADIQADAIKREHRAGDGLKTLRHLVDRELARRNERQLFRDREPLLMAKPHGVSISLEVSVLPLRKPASFPSCTAFAINSFGTAVVNLIRFHAGETASGAKVVFVSAASSSISSFCASSGFVLDPVGQLRIRGHHFLRQIPLAAKKLRARDQPGRDHILVFEKDPRLRFAFQSRYPWLNCPHRIHPAIL